MWQNVTRVSVKSAIVQCESPFSATHRNKRVRRHRDQMTRGGCSSLGLVREPASCHDREAGTHVRCEMSL